MLFRLGTVRIADSHWPSQSVTDLALLPFDRRYSIISVSFNPHCGRSFMMFFRLRFRIIARHAWPHSPTWVCLIVVMSLLYLFYLLSFLLASGFNLYIGYD